MFYYINFFHHRIINFIFNIKISLKNIFIIYKFEIKFFLIISMIKHNITFEPKYFLI